MSEVVASTSRDGGTFHEPGCHFAGRANPENRVTLDSPDAAEGQGYQPCTFCFPERRKKGRRGRTDRNHSPSSGYAPSLDRGVYTAGFADVDGNEVFIAIDSRGREVARTSVTRREVRDRILRRFRMLLDIIDPVGWQERKRAVERRKGLELIH